MRIETAPMGWNSWNTFGPNISDSLIRETALAMKEQGYSGNLTYESVYGHIPDALLPAYLDYIRAVGEHLLSL